MRNFIKFLICASFLALASSVSAQNAAPYVAAGNQLLAAKDYAKAAQYYEAATKMDPNNAAAQQGLGNCRYYQGDKAGALSAYEKALAIDPSNTSLSSFVQTLRAQVGSPASGLPAAASTTSPSFSASPKPTTKQSTFEVDVTTGLALALSDGYGIGFGASGAGFIPLGQGLSLGGELGFHTFGTVVPGLGVSSLSILAAGKYALPANGMKPYLLGGVGISMYMVSYPDTYGIPSSSDIHPMIQAGGGVAFPMGPDMDIFGQLTADVLIGSNGTFTYLPFGVGLAFNL